MGLAIIGGNLLYLGWIFGSLFREYLARHQSRGTHWLAQKCHKQRNPLILAVLAIPCLVLLLLLSLMDAICCIVSCNGRHAKTKSKETPLSQIVPANLLQRQNMKLKEAIHIHMQHAKMRLKAVKHMQVAKQSADVHRMKLGMLKSCLQCVEQLFLLFAFFPPHFLRSVLFPLSSPWSQQIPTSSWKTFGDA